MEHREFGVVEQDERELGGWRELGGMEGAGGWWSELGGGGASWGVVERVGGKGVGGLGGGMVEGGGTKAYHAIYKIIVI